MLLFPRKKRGRGGGSWPWNATFRLTVDPESLKIQIYVPTHDAE